MSLKVACHSYAIPWDHIDFCCCEHVSMLTLAFSSNNSINWLRATWGYAVNTTCKIDTANKLANNCLYTSSRRRATFIHSVSTWIYVQYPPCSCAVLNAPHQLFANRGVNCESLCWFKSSHWAHFNNSLTRCTGEDPFNWLLASVHLVYC